MEDTLVAGFPVGVVGLQGETCLDGEVQAGFILEVNADVVIVGAGGKLYCFNDLAFGLREQDQLAVRRGTRGAPMLGAAFPPPGGGGATRVFPVWTVGLPSASCASGRGERVKKQFLA